MLALSIKTIAGVQREFVLNSNGPWRIGRKAPCEIQVPDRFISSVHAELSLTRDGLRLRRLKDLNPICIGDAEIDSAIVEPGSCFKIGKTEFHVIETGAVSGTSMLDSRAILAAAPAQPGKHSGIRMAVAEVMKELSRIAECRQESELNQAVLRLVCERLGAERGVMARTGVDSALTVIATHKFDDKANIQELISTTVLKKVLNETQTVLIANVATHHSLGAQQSVQENKICAVACAPFLNPDMSVAGVIYVDNQSREAEFDSRDAEFLLWAGHYYKLLSERILLQKRLEIQVEELKHAAVADVQMVAASQAIIDVLERARKVAPTDISVLILGESGSGKECVAKFIHRQSARAKGPFIARNCAAIPEALFESEMFGCVKGAFFGADADRNGAFSEAAGGTLFLDEIAEMSPTHQAKILRVIEDKRVLPVGTQRDRAVEVRVVCATNSDLQAAVKARRFREDLFFRLADFVLEVPPLRQRRDDILPLATHFTRQESNGASVLSANAESRLLVHEWRGNVRELRSVIRNAVLMSRGKEIQIEDLGLPTVSGRSISLSSKAQTLVDVEREHIRKIMRQFNGNITQAAEFLGIARSTLVLKLKEIGIR